MAQATPKRHVSPHLFSHLWRGLREVWLWSSLLIAVYLAVALLSYTPQDPSWSHSAEAGPVDNAGGLIGAYLADALFSLLGRLAYPIPLVVAFAGWSVYRERQQQALVRERPSRSLLLMRAVGVLLTLPSATGLLAMHGQANGLFAPGGILGTSFNALLVGWFNPFGASLMLLALFVSGVTLMTGLSWFWVMDMLGAVTLKVVGWAWVGLQWLFGWRRADEDADWIAEPDPPATAERGSGGLRGRLLGLLPARLRGRREAAAGGSSEAGGPAVEPGPIGVQRELPFGHGLDQTDPLAAGPDPFVTVPAAAPIKPAAEPDGHPAYPLRATDDDAFASDAVVGDGPGPVPTTPFYAQDPDEQGATGPAAGETGPLPQHGFERERRPDEGLVAEQAPADSAAPAQAPAQAQAQAQDGTADGRERYEPVIRFTDSPLPVDEADPIEPTLGEIPAIDQDGLDWPSQPVPAAAPVADRYPVYAYEQDDEEEEADAEDQAALFDDWRRPDEMAGSPPSVPTTLTNPAAEPAPASNALAAAPAAPWAVPMTGPAPLPPLALLDRSDDEGPAYSRDALDHLSRLLEEKLGDFRVKVQVVAVHPGPVITRFELAPAPGIKVSRITNLSKDIARSMSVTSVRVVEVIPGKATIGLEIPNHRRETVRLRELFSSPQYDHSHSALTLALGRDIGGKPVVVDLAKMPHLLVAGTTGSGKSVSVNAMILSLLYKARPSRVRLIMIDPKMLELSVYDGIPHLLAPVVTDMKEAAHALRWCVVEMERRYQLMAAMGVRNLKGFNQKVKAAIDAGTPIPDPTLVDDEGPAAYLEPLPFIVVVVDELADLMMVVGKKIEELIARLAQKARAAGIHLILATQRPSVDVITGLIKANIPTRIAFQVSSKVDSRTILDQGGAEALLGMGDMLYLPPGTAIPIRVHGAFVDDHEVHNVVEHLKATGEADYLEGVLDEDGTAVPEGVVVPGDPVRPTDETDVLYDQAVRIVTETRRASVSGVQRRLRIGYNRAARLVESMEQAGVVGPLQANGSREVLAPPPVEV